jgi:hypothetical protein
MSVRKYVVMAGTSLTIIVMMVILTQEMAVVSYDYLKQAICAQVVLIQTRTLALKSAVMGSILDGMNVMTAI